MSQDKNPYEQYVQHAAPEAGSSNPYAEFAQPRRLSGAPAAEPKAAGFGEAAWRGFKRSLPETKSLLYGAAAATGGLVGADGLRDWGLENYQRVQREEVEPLQNNSSFKGSVSGDASFGEWAGDTLGNFGGQALQSLAVSAAGAAAGGAAGAPAGGVGAAPGAVVGAVGGLVAKTGAKKLINAEVRNLVEQQLAKGVGLEAAELAGSQLAKKRLAQLGGGALANTGLNVGQEVGIAYTGRADDAAEAGEALTSGDAARAIAWGVPAGLVDSAAEGLIAGRLFRGASASPQMGRRMLTGAVEGAITEGATEGVQAVMERAGARQALTGAEAYDDYLENVAAGALGGSVPGAASGFRRRLPQNAPEEQSSVPQQAPLALPPPEAVTVDPEGQAVTAAQAYARDAADAAFAQERQNIGLTPDVNQARAQHPAAAPVATPTLPDGSPVPDASNGPLSRAVNVAVNNGAAQAAADVQAMTAALQGEPVAPRKGELIESTARRLPSAPRGVDPATGEVLQRPGADEMRSFLHRQMETNGRMPAVSTLARAMGVDASEAQQVVSDVFADRRALNEEAKTNARAAGRSEAGRGDLARGAVDAGGVPVEGVAVPQPVSGAESPRSAPATAAVERAATEPLTAPSVVQAAAAEAATSPANARPEPTEAQKEAGNYKKGHARVAGLDVSIENPAGTSRRPEWPPLQDHYGYFKGSKGADKDHVDVFMTDRAEDESLPVFVVDQVNKDGSFDEHKVVMGAPSEADARQTYLRNYEPGWDGLGGITQMSQEEFRRWVKDPSKTTVPAAAQQVQQAAPGRAAIDTREVDRVMGAKASELTTVRNVHGEAFKVRKKDLEGSRVLLPTYDASGKPRMTKQGVTRLHRDNIASDEQVATYNAGAKTITRRGARNTKEEGFSKPEVVQREIKRRGLDPANYEVRKHFGGYVGVLKEAPDTAIKSQPPTAGNEGRGAQPTSKGDGAARTEIHRRIDQEFAENLEAIAEEGIGAGDTVKFRSGDETLAAEVMEIDNEQGTLQVRLENGAIRIVPGRVAVKPGGDAAPTGKPEKKAKKPARAPEASANTIFTEDAAERARATLRSKLSQLNSGIDPEILQAGITLAGYHIEKGARTFAAYAQAMLADLGEGVRPYLKSWYMGVRFDPRATDFEGMDSAAAVESADVDAIAAAAAQTEYTEQGNADEQPTGPELGAADQAGAQAPAGRRGRDAQPGAASADPGNVEGNQPGTAGEPAARGDGRRTGVRAAAENVDGAGRADGSRTTGDRRARAGRAEQPDAGSQRRGVAKSPAEVSPANPGPGNFHIADPTAIAGGGPVARFKKSQAAIELFNELSAVGREPTIEEQAVLAGYTGWGSFGQELFQGTWERPRPKAGWEQRDAWLRENLGREAWESAQRSITNAHYTDPPTVAAMWDMVKTMGFQGGRVLEPAMGIGNFFGLMPQALQRRSQLAGIELDQTTGGMAKLLYPGANVRVMPYQESKTPDNFYDLVIGNWPFENTVIADRRYQRLNPHLHDYFFLKALDQTRPGGLVVGITSAGTMDKKGFGVRAELAKKGELLAAFRLPSGAFEEYAGTQVVTDILILRKRDVPLAQAMDAGWIESKELMTPAGEPVLVNEYFHANPDHVVGQIDHGQGANSARPGMLVRRPADMGAELQRIARLVPKGAYQKDARPAQVSYITNHTADRENALTKTEKGFFIVRGEHLAPASEVIAYAVKDPAKTAARERQLSSLIDMRQQYAALIEAERAGTDAEQARTALRALYDGFVQEHGRLGASYGLQYLRKVDDPFYPALAALEVPDSRTQGFRPARILTESTTRGARRIENPSVADAFVLARNRSINPSAAEIAEIASRPEAEVKAELIQQGAVFELPGGDILPSDIYLSGNVREKLRQAQAAVAEGMGHIQRNVDALKEVVPADIPYYKIETQLGATWVPVDAYRDYIAHMLGTESAQGVEVSFSAGRWRVRIPDSMKGRAEARTNFGTDKVPFQRLMNAAISNQTITLHRPARDGGGVDVDATKEVTEKIANIRGRFAEWLWSDAERKVAVEREYNEVRNAYATPKFDGSFLSFEGMALSLGSGPFDLRDHQRNAIWRGLVMRKSINAHEVGTGKTFTMGGIAVESRRYGIAKKPLLLAHNANSASVAAEIQMMYPAAKVLYVDNLSPATVDVKLRQIANDDWDAVVLPHSLMDRLTFRKDTLMGLAAEEIAQLEEAAHEAASDDGTKLTPEMLADEDELKKLRSPTAKELVKIRNRILNSIQIQADRASRPGAIPFEELGIDMVLVDEAHEFKKPPFTTKMRMKGLQTQSSAQSIGLNFLTRYVRTNNNGNNVHLFTGTPVTNTMTEVFHQMRYVMAEEMEAAGVDQWDGWFGSFAREVQDVELNAAAEYEAVTRLAAFINVPELRRMVGQYMDVVFADDMPEMRPRRTASGKRLGDKTLTEAESAELLNGRTEGAKDRPYKKVVVETADLTAPQKAAFERIQGYARSWRGMTSKARKEAMLAGLPESPIITEGLANKASLDVRLLDGEKLAGQEGRAEDDPNSKASRLVRNVADLYRSHPEANQVIFTELGISTTATRKVGPVGARMDQRYKVFSTIQDVVARLVEQGIPRDQIALVDGSTSKEKRKEVADRMNRSEIRVVIGSTASLGVGVNMQRNLRAMHHLDAPWMPGDLEQRNGRGHRQGNQWNTVLEYRYLTDRLDGRRWQVLAVKDRFIKAFLRSKGDERVIEGEAAAEEQSDILQTFAEAAGDPRILIREKLRKKIEGLQSRERLHSRGIADSQSKIRSISNRADRNEVVLSKIEKAGAVDAVDTLVAMNAGKGFSMDVDGRAHADRKEASEAIGKWISANMRVGDGPERVATFGEFPVKAMWDRYAEVPHLVLDVHGVEITSNQPTVASLEAALRRYPVEVRELAEGIAEDRATAERLRKATTEPFHMGDQLKAAEKALVELERDIQANPVPPPAWLRSGAPVETEVVWNGKTFEVTGHRWTADGWFVVGRDARGEVAIPYAEATDGQGMPLYEPRTFESPVLVDKKAAPAEAVKLSRPAEVAPRGISAAQAKKAIGTVTAKWGSEAPAVVVLESHADLPARAKSDPEHVSAEGFYDDSTGTVYLVANNLSSPQRALQVLSHEAVGHFGIEAITGDRTWADIARTIDRMRAGGKHAALFAEIDRRYRGANREIGIREAVAVMAEKGVRNSVIDRAVTAVRNFLRQLGFTLQLSEAELRQHLVAASRYVRGGARPRASSAGAGLAFSRTAGDLNQSIPVVDVTVGDISPDLPPKEARRVARDYLVRMRDAGTVMHNDDKGWDIGLTRRSINELVSFRPEKLLLVPALPQITKAAVLGRSRPNADTSAVNPSGDSVVAYHDFYAPVRIGDDLRVARVVVQEQRNGKFAYDLQQSDVLENVSPAEAVREPGHIQGASRPTTGLTALTLSQLRDAVNSVDRPGWVMSRPDQVRSPEFREWFGRSQVADASGDPKVVYHGTGEEFWSFDPARLGRSTGHMTAPLGFFFDESKAKAKRYAEKAADGVPADERVIDAYLSLQNPKPMTLDQFLAVDSFEEAKALRSALKAEGHDGIHLAEIGQWIAFEPGQVKSATANTGAFNSRNADMRYSKPDPEATVAAVDAALGGPSSRVADKLKAMFRGLKPENLRENTRPAWLGALTLRHLAELGSDLHLQQVAAYADRVQQMATDRNIMQEEAAGIADSWEKFQRKDRAGADATANLMHDTTIEGVDPSQDYVPLRTGATRRGPDEIVTPSSIERRKASVAEDMRQARSSEAVGRLEAELQALDDLLAQEQARKAVYPELVRRFLALPAAGQQLYRTAKQAYVRQSEQMEQALIDRIEALQADRKSKATMVSQIRQQFESARLNGPYFPLQRFGQFWISATDAAGEPAFLMYEKVEQWREAQRELPARGFTVKKAGRKLDEARSLAGASGGFMADLQELLANAGIDESTRDDVYQLYLRTLPELSVRKHQIHRKGTAGYSADALRSFSSNLFHGSFQVARLRHAHELDADLMDMKAAVDRLTESDPERAAKGAALYSEMNKRHEWVMNPKDSKTVSGLTSLGFAWYLGTTPAAALVNLSQTAIVTFPVLAARFGVGKAFSALSSGMGLALRTATGDITGNLNAEERAAYHVWRTSGAIDKSQAHNLAGLSETDTRAFNPAVRKGMQVISWLFHKAEVVNREATALAAFRLARQGGQTFNEAVKYAGDVVTESHFDYSNANRARFMQSNAAKVLLLFRQYSLNMTWFLWRNLYQSIKGQAPEVRREARTKLGGVLGMTGLFAGLMGMPLTSVMFGLADAAASAFGDDDDEPFDSEVAFRNFLADLLGADAARILAKGPVDYFTSASIGSRVSLNDLWFREPNRELEGKEMADYLLEQAGGPLFGGMLVNTLRGLAQVQEGHTWRGVETMMPKAVKDGMKSVRYTTQGVNTLRGDPVIEDLGVGGSLLQLAGFSPASLNERYEGINAAKNYEKRLLDRRSSLLNAYAMAWRAGDADTVTKVLGKIRSFNEAQPELAINTSTIRDSLQARMRYSSRAEGGVVLNPKIADKAREEARFAE